MGLIYLHSHSGKITFVEIFSLYVFTLVVMDA